MRYMFFFLFTLTLYAQEPHPISKIQHWFNDEKKMTEGPCVMSGYLASVSRGGMPHNRTIQIAYFDQNKGACFFTHAQSCQVKDFESTPYASLIMHFPKTRRHVNLEGRVEDLSVAEREKYWKKLACWKKSLFFPSNDVAHMQGENISRKKNACSDNKTAMMLMPPTFLGYRLVPAQVTFYETGSSKTGSRKMAKKETLVLEKNQWTHLR